MATSATAQARAVHQAMRYYHLALTSLRVCLEAGACRDDAALEELYRLVAEEKHVVQEALSALDPTGKES